MANGELKEILFTIDDIRKGDIGEIDGSDSIFRKAQPAILHFPVIVSDSISITDLSMIVKALEREYATVVRLAMGLDDVMDSGNNRRMSKIDYIKKFHSNTYISGDRYVRELFESVNIDNLNIFQEDTVDYEKDVNKLKLESLGINFNNLNDMTLISEGRVRTSKKTTITSYGDIVKHKEGNDGSEESSMTKRNSTTTTERFDNKKNNKTSNGIDNINTMNGGDTSDKIKKGYNNSLEHIKRNQDVTTVADTSYEYETMTRYNDYRGQLLDNDVKKANELIPTTLDITVYQKVGEEVITDHILLGVKCVAHKVHSQDMVENIYNTLESKKGFFRFIQWTTGEIKFFKDYLLCLDTLKKEALQSRAKDKSATWFRELKNKATISRLRSTFNLKNQLIPNSTLVLSMDEVDFIRNTYNIDLINDRKKVELIMKTFFLIGFVIVDSGSELVYFKFDGFDKYNMHSYNSLERENRNQGNDIKALVSLMTKY